MKIGILGGTFDPIHNAHICLAIEAKKQYALDKVWMMPTLYPPHKDKNKITDSFHRQKMIELALQDIPDIELSNFELFTNHITYTADTLTILHKLHPNVQFYFIMGSDSANSFMNWHHPDIIVKYAHLLVGKRSDESSELMEDRIREIENTFHISVGRIMMESSAVSSRFIRTHSYQTIRTMVPDVVYQYIIKNNLYNNQNVHSEWTVNEIKKDLQLVLNAKRMKHSLGVAHTAKDMAEHFGVQPKKALLAGILHDCAKELSDQELVRYSIAHKITISNTEQHLPHLLHAKVGVRIATEKYGITDQEILSAIRWHTTGKSNMTTLEKIIFCADYIEPGRVKQPNLPSLRELACKDIDLLTYYILRDTIRYLKEAAHCMIDVHTVEACQFYKKIIAERKNQGGTKYGE